jgi:alpha-L-rhamnosidase
MQMTTTIRQVLPGVKKYLSVWKTDENGHVENRPGGWTWGDWGMNKDMPVLYDAWYALACKGYAHMADALGKKEESAWAEERIEKIGENFNSSFWTGTEYRSPGYEGETDDRANALAVLAGFAGHDQYQLLKKVFEKNRHASPYMEKYVLEALFIMGYDEFALSRMKERFLPMIESELTTLWEGWGIGTEGYGEGTYNHGWSGGGLTMLSKYVAGIKPLKPGFEEVEIKPAIGGLKHSKARVSTVKGLIEVENDLNMANVFVQKISTPGDVEISVCFPKTIKRIRSASINDKLTDRKTLNIIRLEHGMKLPGGEYEIVVRY